MTNLLDVTEYAIIKYQKTTKLGYKYSMELAKRTLQRNYAIAPTVQKGEVIEIRQYGNMKIKADVRTKKIIGFEQVKQDTQIRINLDLKIVLDKELNILEMEKDEGIKETKITKNLFDINKTSFVSYQKILERYDLSYIHLRQMINKEINNGQELATIKGIKYVKCKNFVAIINIERNLIQYISWNDSERESIA